MAKAAKTTIVEAENIVEAGEIDPNDVHLPGIFVDRIVPATVEKVIEITKTRPREGASAAAATAATQKTVDAGQGKRNRIGRRAAEELREGYYVNLGVGKSSFRNPCWRAILSDRYNRNSDIGSVVPPE
jgi:3-oxoacid CoA-transferase